jgi:hypothetical protein
LPEFVNQVVSVVETLLVFEAACNIEAVKEFEVAEVFKDHLFFPLSASSLLALLLL